MVSVLSNQKNLSPTGKERSKFMVKKDKEMTEISITHPMIKNIIMSKITIYLLHGSVIMSVIGTSLDVIQ